MKNTVSSRLLRRSWQLLAAMLMMIVLIAALNQQQASAGQPLAQEPDGLARLMADSGGEAQISFNRATGVASFVRMPRDAAALSLLAYASPDDAADAFFQRYGDAFGIQESASELVLVNSTPVALADGTQLTYQQIYEDVPVFAAILKARTNGRNQISSVNGTFVPNIKLRSTSPTLSAAEAGQIAVDVVAGQRALNALPRLSKLQDTSGSQNATIDLAAVGQDLYVYRTGLAQGIPGRDHLVYEVEVTNSDISVREFVFVDAHTGQIVDQISGIQHSLDREVSEGSLANVVWSEGDTDPIPGGWAGGSAQQVTDWQNEIDGASESYYLFASMASRDSYDAAGAQMRTVNNDPGINCPNANWNGTSTNYCSNVTGDDTVAHEWGHAYTQYTNNLIYQWQSGALNESYSDIWGEVVDLLNGRGTDTPDVVRSSNTCSSNPAGSNLPGNPTVNTVRWLSGEDDPAFGGAIRDMWDPTCFGDPGKVSDDEYWCQVEDGGGVHTNSGVPNHAFGLLVDGGTYNGQTVSAIGLTKASHIHWGAQNMLTPASNFADHADALEAACTALIGVNLPALSTGVANPGLSGEMITNADCQEVAAAIAAVEFRTQPTQCNFGPLLDPNAPPLCENMDSIQSIAHEDWESGSLPAGWSVGTRDVANPPTFDTPDWDVVGSLPSGANGSYAAFVPDLVIGDCGADDESGVLYLDSPATVIPAGAMPRMAFDHWVATEAGWDGGNVKVSINGGPWTLLAAARFEFNGYNTTLNTAGEGNTNPLGGEPAFSGSDGGSTGGSWGQTQVNLIGLANPGDSIRFRFEFGIDGCNGLAGWYVDDVQLYSCSADQPPCGDGILDLGETCDDGNQDSGDGCSNTCQVEEGWTCTDPVTPSPGNNVIADGSFEAGFNAGIWDEYSLNFGTPICDSATCNANYHASDGDYWTWFGGIPAYEEGSVAQMVQIPATATDLTFDMMQPVCDSGDDYMRLLVDGNVEFYSDGSSGLCGGNSYSEQTVDLSSYADGGTHALEFHSETFATNGGLSNFFLDKVVLSDNMTVGGQPSICTPDSIVEYFIYLPAIVGSPAN